MDRYGIGTASYAELVWTLFCTVGMVVCVVLLRESLGDYRWLRDNGHNGERRLLALDAVVAESASVATLGLFALLGIWSLFIPSPNASGKPTELAISVTVVFCLMAVTMTAHAFLRRYWRDEYIRRRLKRNRAAPAVAAPITVVVDTHDIDSLEITTQAADADAP